MFAAGRTMPRKLLAQDFVANARNKLVGLFARDSQTDRQYSLKRIIRVSANGSLNQTMQVRPLSKLCKAQKTLPHQKPLTILLTA